MGAIYIAHDQTKPNLVKLGMTTKNGKHRVSQTENPDYVLFKDYTVRNELVKYYESIIHCELEKLYSRRNHKSTGNRSEWFECSPLEATLVCEDILGLKNKKEIVNISHEMKLLASDNSKLEKENVLLLEQVYNLTSMLDSSSELKKTIVKNDKLKKSKKDANTKIHELQNDNDRLNKEIVNLTIDVSRLARELKNEQDSIEALQLEATFLNSNNEQLKQSLERFTSFNPSKNKTKTWPIRFTISLAVLGVTLFWYLTN